MAKVLAHNHNKGETCEPCNIAMGMYQCYWCRQYTYKENWGPGWVRCPKCKQIAPSALEEQGQEAKSPPTVPPPAEWPFTAEQRAVQCTCSYFNSEIVDYKKNCPQHGSYPEAT